MGICHEKFLSPISHTFRDGREHSSRQFTALHGAPAVDIDIKSECSFCFAHFGHWSRHAAPTANVAKKSGPCSLNSKSRLRRLSSFRSPILVHEASNSFRLPSMFQAVSVLSAFQVSFMERGSEHHRRQPILPRARGVRIPPAPRRPANSPV